ncbi:ATP-binding protein [uncultured Phascolarctobacterium sp.]|uniref:AAA family ATPase n=1 Tax=uncultured Phascolarctobacterium sp. TaxID=512296 RepID=UPI002627D671|nr:ATP-binding protein [uncultured Phascolarctobacterium sp.]
MLLEKFSVENYKNFQHRFELDLSDVRDYKFNKESIIDGVVKTGVIYGKNSVGKTNFGYAIFDITYHIVDKMKRQEVSRYYVNADSDNDIVTFMYQFRSSKGEKIAYKYKKKNSYELVEEELLVNDEEWFSYDFTKKKGNLSRLKQIKELKELNWQFKDKGMSFIRFISNNSNLPNDNPLIELYRFVNKMLWFKSVDGFNQFIGFSAVPDDILDYVLRNDLLEELNTFLKENGVDERFVCEVTPDNKKVVYFAHKTLLPYELASSGTKALILFFYWYKQFSMASFVFIDEFDAFYHFELAEKILRIVMRQNSQVLLTSHNTNLLSTKIMRPDCYFILTKEKITSFANATVRELREGHNLEKLFISGEFNG